MFYTFSPSPSIPDAIVVAPDLRVIHVQWEQLKTWSFKDLRAYHWRIYWNSAPGARIVINSKEIELTPDHFLVIPPDTTYDAHPAEEPRQLYIHFLTKQVWTKGGAYQISTTPEEIGILQELNKMSQIPSGWAVLGIIGSCLSKLPAEGWKKPDKESLRIRTAQETISNHLKDPVRVSILAKEAGMNVNAFIRLFQDVTGTTPARYAREKRLESACLQLHLTNRSIDEVAESCGFCDRYHFTRIFTKFRAVSPAAFRRQQGSIYGFRTADAAA